MSLRIIGPDWCDNDMRNKVRVIVREKAREISDGAQVGQIGGAIPSMVFTPLIQEYFEKIGLERSCELEPDENHFNILVMPGLVMKVDNDTAEKILVLGLP